MSAIPAELLTRIPEKVYQQQIVTAAGYLGWRHVYHTHDSRRCAAGFPDLVMIRHGRLVVAEIKRERGRVTPAQQEWLDAFRACGVDAFVWRPSDWESVQAVLDGSYWLPYGGQP